MMIQALFFFRCLLRFYVFQKGLEVPTVWSFYTSSVVLWGTAEKLFLRKFFVGRLSGRHILDYDSYFPALNNKNTWWIFLTGLPFFSRKMEKKANEPTRRISWNSRYGWFLGNFSFWYWTVKKSPFIEKSFFWQIVRQANILWLIDPFGVLVYFFRVPTVSFSVKGLIGQFLQHYSINVSINP